MIDTEQKMKFSIEDFFSKCDQICRKLRIWSHLLRETLMENIFWGSERKNLLLICWFSFKQVHT